MKKMLVIGIGSRIMMDDAIGINIVEDLKTYEASPLITYLQGETDFDYCFEEVLNCDYLIIIDAYMSGKEPGEMSIIPINQPNEVNADSFYSMHGIHLLSLLQNSRHLPEGILIGIEPYVINYGFTLSDKLQSCYTSILCEVRQLIFQQVEKLQKGAVDK